MNINFRLLHMFLLVAEHSSFKQAAEEAGRSQSAVSMQIKQLESQLGVALFHRTTRRIQLTVEGQQLLQYARRAVGELQSGLRHLRDVANVQSGHLSVGCVPTFAFSRLPDILSEFSRRYPAVSMEVREVPAADLLASVARQEVDFGIGPQVPNKCEFDFHPLVTEGSYALIPDILAPAGTSVTLEQVSKWPMLTLALNSRFRTQLDDIMHRRGLSVESRFQFTQVKSIIAMVAAGLGAAILPKMAFSSIEEKGITVLPIDDPELERTICIITLRGQAFSPAAAKLVKIIEQAVNPDVKQSGGR
jgi:DNA-binding transcriptional LysR family regulator